MFIREKQIKLIAVVMGIIGIAVFSITLFLEDVKTKNAILKLCSVNVPEREWEYIVLHHSATLKGNAAKFDDYHRNKRKWKNGLAYHFVIGNGTNSGDGEIEVGSRWEKQIHGAHTGKMKFNKVAIGVCLVGNFETQKGPTEEQLESLLHLVEYLCKKYEIPINKVIGHKQMLKNHTSCPGKHFPIDEFKGKLSQIL